MSIDNGSFPVEEIIECEISYELYLQKITVIKPFYKNEFLISKENLTDRITSKFEQKSLDFVQNCLNYNKQSELNENENSFFEYSFVRYFN